MADAPRKLAGDTLSDNQNKTAMWIGAVVMLVDLMNDNGFTAADFNVDPRWIEVIRSPKLVALITLVIMLWSHSRARASLGAVKEGIFRRIVIGPVKPTTTQIQD